MKKYTVILAVFAMFAFSACNKEEKGYTVNDNGTINFTIGTDEFENTDKQAFSGERYRIFFTSGDQIMVNGNVCDMTVLPTTVAGLPSNVSNKARINNVVPSSSDYKFYFTAATYTVRTDGSYEVNMLSEVNLLGNGLSAAFDNNNQAWPMYAECEDLTTIGENGIKLLNAVNVFAFNFRYGTEWAAAAFGTIAGVESFTPEQLPQVYVTELVLKADTKLTGTATLLQHPTNPRIVMDNTLAAGELDQITMHVTNPQVLSPYFSDATGGNAVNNVVGNLPLAPTSGNVTYQLDVYFYAVINGVTKYYKFETVPYFDEYPNLRNRRDEVRVNFHIVGDDPAVVNADGSITFENGTLSAPSNTTLFGITE